MDELLRSNFIKVAINRNVTENTTHILNSFYAILPSVMNVIDSGPAAKKEPTSGLAMNLTTAFEGPNENKHQIKKLISTREHLTAARQRSIRIPKEHVPFT